MQKAWLKTIAAGLSAVGMAGAPAVGSPAGMAVSSARQATPTGPASVAARPADAWQAGAARPSSLISPVKHPWKYFAAALSEMPIGSKGSGPTHPVAEPAPPQNNDSIAPSTPVGPSTPELSISTAQRCERQGDIRQARHHLGQALTMWPSHVEVLRAAARMEDRLGDLKLAETLYQQAVASNPQHAGALNDLGLCLARQGKLDASVQVIEQAIHLQPEKALYRNNAATVLVELRQDQRALGHLAAVHGAADANYNLGQLLVQRGRAADATPYFQAAVEQNPEMEPARVALGMLQGTNTTNAAATETATSNVPQQSMPAAAPVAAPQQAPQPGPQFYYPATARTPELGASTYAPPRYYAPTAAPVRYLPPVASRPGATQR